MATAKKKSKKAKTEPESATTVASVPTTTTTASPTPAPTAAHSAADPALKADASTPAKPLSFAEMVKKNASKPVPAAPAKTTATAPAKAAEPEWSLQPIDAAVKQHILDRHGPDSTTTDAGHFYGDWDEIDDLISYAVENGTYQKNTQGRPGYIYECDCGDYIGENLSQKATRWIRVVVQDDGSVTTAFPK